MSPLPKMQLNTMIILLKHTLAMDNQNVFNRIEPLRKIDPGLLEQFILPINHTLLLNWI